jgi:UDP-N-acetyl-2-amino-2-deoxyglucuronate dehydrogenase
MLDFSLIGAAGFVAPRHMHAIRETGNALVSVFDIHDTLGVMDGYFPDAQCFSDPMAYRAFHSRNPPDILSICSPNHLHFDHIDWGLGWGADVICEKPMVMDPAQLDVLKAMETRYGKRVFTILQLRLLPAMQELQTMVRDTPAGRYDVEVDYVTGRGNWYFHSWKGREEKSGGLIVNIGIHLFDLLLWIFGPCNGATVHRRDDRSASGSLELEKARVKWKLSVDTGELPDSVVKAGGRTFRQMRVNGRQIRLDQGLERLHTLCYTEILAGRGPGISEAEPSIRLCDGLRHL